MRSSIFLRLSAIPSRTAFRCAAYSRLSFLATFAMYSLSRIIVLASSGWRRGSLVEKAHAGGSAPHASQVISLRGRAAASKTELSLSSRAR